MFRNIYGLAPELKLKGKHGVMLKILKFIMVFVQKDGRDCNNRDMYKIDMYKLNLVVKLSVIVGGEMIAEMFDKYGFVNGDGFLDKSKGRKRKKYKLNK